MVSLNRFHFFENGRKTTYMLFQFLCCSWPSTGQWASSDACEISGFRQRKNCGKFKMELSSLVSEEFMRQMVVFEGKTHREIACTLKDLFPDHNLSGLSERSVRRFCEIHEIKRCHTPNNDQ